MPIKMISLSQELLEELKKEENASGLISSLLQEHYRKKHFIGMSLEELQKEKQKREIRRIAEEKIKELDDGRA